jgi:hypothetical protein
MKVLLVSFLFLLMCSEFSEASYPEGLEASEIVRKGNILAVDLRDRAWHILVDYRNVLYACETVPGFQNGMGIYCLPLPYAK